MVDGVVDNTLRIAGLLRPLVDKLQEKLVHCFQAQRSVCKSQDVCACVHGVEQKKVQGTRVICNA